MTSTPEGVVQVAGRGRGPENGPGSFLILYETAILAFAAALTIWFAASGDARLAGSTPFLLTVLALWGLFDLVGYVVFPREAAWVSVRLTGDMTFCLFLVAWTGGAESFLMPILLASLALASTLFGRRRALLLASGAALLLIVVTVGRMGGWTLTALYGVSAGPNVLEWSLAINLLAQLTALFAVALLGSRLGGGLREAERLNDLIVQAIGEGILIIDREGTIRHVNREARRILGYPEEMEWRGRTARDVLRRTEDDALRRELESPEPGERLVEYRIDRGERVPLRLRTTVTETGPNGGRTWVFLMRDLRLEQRVARAEARLEHLEELEDLALGLAHEIRNPLASIRGGVQELASGRLDEGQSERLARLILRESDRLDRTVSQFMEYSRSRSRDTREIVPVEECLREVRELLEQRSDSRGIELAVDVEPGLDASVEGSHDLLHKLFLNLGINAIEACRGDGHVAYRVRAGRAGGIEVVVEDDGAGMDEATRARAFHPFYTTKTREGGLGLAIVKKIVDGHRGSIEIESEKGLGTRIRVWLPGAATAAALSRQLESSGARP